MHNRPTLRRSLLTYLLIPLGLLWLFSAVATYYIAKNYSNLAYDNALFDSVETVEEHLRLKDGKSQLDLPEIAWDILGFDKQDEVYFEVRRADGSPLAGGRDIPDPPEGNKTRGQAIFHDSVMDGKSVRVASLYVNLGGGNPDNQVLVQVAETLNKRESLARQILSEVAIPQIVLILLAAVSVWVGVSRSLAPLENLRTAIRNRSHHDLSPISEDPAPQEVQPLLHSINDLMQRFGQVLVAQQHFIADAAHQLRTPLAGLTTQTELALRQTDPAALQHAVGQIRVSVERTNHLVQQLLALAHAEVASTMAMHFESLDLDVLTRTLTTEWVPQAIAKDIDLGYEGPGQPTMVRGHALLLREMLANILNNAVCYTPAHGKVTVRLTTGRHPLLSIEDNGPGVPADEHERVFERFHRVPGSSGMGSGLGLAIAREIAHAHGARVWLESAGPRGGARACIEFMHTSAE